MKKWFFVIKVYFENHRLLYENKEIFYGTDEELLNRKFPECYHYVATIYELTPTGEKIERKDLENRCQQKINYSIK